MSLLFSGRKEISVIEVRVQLVGGSQISATVLDKRAGKVEKIAPQSDKAALLDEMAGAIERLYAGTAPPGQA